MILAGQFWPPLVSGQADTFLFSGGGNDVLGGEAGSRGSLRLFDVDHTKPSDAAYYIKPEFYDNLKLILQNYEIADPARARTRPERDHARARVMITSFRAVDRAMDWKRHDVRRPRSHLSRQPLPGYRADHDRCLQ